MARSNRPELIKDNPVAPQMYVRRRTTGRGGGERSTSVAAERAELQQALQTLAGAAETFLQATPQWKRAERERQMLLDALTQAQLVLSAEGLAR
ncbi:hypothetical protein [Nitrospira moscoviensis]|uniref:Uncharacterized protein n=1 Tax=Nitrospira moscoviensis TaxID=42253 RepID=A0A0K2GCE6_NITMO|nr:hypothetical protein [Nitrospira moscoviensis]ALA58630.1 hypothetical protein NITMOv2_2214 [Nitrospira moscoviensis]